MAPGRLSEVFACWIDDLPASAERYEGIDRGGTFQKGGSKEEPNTKAMEYPISEWLGSGELTGDQSNSGTGKNGTHHATAVVDTGAKSRLRAVSCRPVSPKIITSVSSRC